MDEWIPKTKLGKEVLNEQITSIDEIFEKGLKIREPEIVDKLLPNIKTEIMFVGGSPGKGGGVRRTPTKRTARMHRSGRRYKSSAIVVVGDSNGHLGIGKGSAIENREAIAKATKSAKLNIAPIERGCGNWECKCGEKHSLPIKTEGKTGSVRIILLPAPRGIGLCMANEMKKILTLSGIKDVWSKSFGNIQNRTNMAFAIFEALKNVSKIKGERNVLDNTIKRYSRNK